MALPPTEIRTWTIYKLVNPLGEIYIGKSYNFKNRIRQYRGLSHKTQPLLYKSLQSHGFENHSIEPVDIFESNESYAEGKEMFWIRSYMVNRNKWPEQNGLNLTDGGYGTRGKPHTEEWKKANSLRQMGNKWNLGRVHSAEHKHKISLKQKARGKSEKELAQLDSIRKRIAVIQMDEEGNIIGEFLSIIEAARGLGVSGDTIEKFASGKRLPTKKNKNLYLKFK